MLVPAGGVEERIHTHSNTYVAIVRIIVARTYMYKHCHAGNSMSPAHCMYDWAKAICTNVQLAIYVRMYVRMYVYCTCMGGIRRVLSVCMFSQIRTYARMYKWLVDL